MLPGNDLNRPTLLYQHRLKGEPAQLNQDPLAQSLLSDAIHFQEAQQNRQLPKADPFRSQPLDKFPRNQIRHQREPLGRSLVCRPGR